MPRAWTLLLTLLVASSSLAALAPAAEAASVTPDASKLPQAIVGASAVYVGDSAYVLGGRLKSGEYSRDILRWSPTGGVQDVGDMPDPATDVKTAPGRYSGTAAQVDGRIYYFGGAQLVLADLNGDGQEEAVPKASRDIVSFDPATGQVRLLNDKLPLGAWGMSSVVVEGSIYLFGGFTFDLADLPNTGRHDWVLRFDPAMNEPSPAAPGARIEELQTTMPYAVQDAAVALVGRRVLIMGGLSDHEPNANPCPTYTYYNSTSREDETKQIEVCLTKRIVSFDPSEESVLGVAGELPYRAQFVNAAVIGGKAYVAGGLLSDGSASSSIVEVALDRVGSPQTRILVPPLPRGTFGHAVATDGNTMLAIGGRWGQDAQLTEDILRIDPRATAPWAPRSATIVDINGGVRITWEAPSYNGDAAVTGYRIYRTPSDGAETRLAETTSLSYDDTALKAGTEYTWRIVAVNPAGESTQSARVTRASGIAVPGAVSSFSAFPGNDHVVLRWQPPVETGGSNLSGYRILRNDALLTSLPPDATEHVDATARNGETYLYQVRAFNAKGDGALSASERATPAAVPPAPTNVNVETLANDGATAVRVSWALAEAVDAFIVYRSERLGILGEEVGSVQETSFVDEAVERGQTYYYAVKARNDVGVSPPSAESAVSLVRKPGAPTEVFAFGQEGEIRVSWAPPEDTGDAPAGLLRYYVARSSGGASSIVKTDIETTLFIDRLVSPNVTYSYTVTTLNPMPSDPSLPASAAARPITNKLPVAILAANPPIADAGDPIEIDASNSADLDGSIKSYHFNFGDGTDPVTTQTPTVSHQYALNGTYNATVTITDNRGEQSLAFAQVIVGEVVSEGSPAGNGPLTPPSRRPTGPGSETPGIPGAPVGLVVALVAALGLGMRRRREA